MKGHNVETTKYLIAGAWSALDKVFLYWSNADGWVDRKSATIFTLEASFEVWLPMGAKFIEPLRKNETIT